MKCPKCEKEMMETTPFGFQCDCQKDNPVYFIQVLIRWLMMIMHKAYIKGTNENPSLLYLCNQACSVNTEKLSIYWEKVTCLNCLKHKLTEKW